MGKLLLLLFGICFLLGYSVGCAAFERGVDYGANAADTNRDGDVSFDEAKAQADQGADFLPFPWNIVGGAGGGLGLWALYSWRKRSKQATV